MKMKCLNKRCGYEGEFCKQKELDTVCPYCKSIMISVKTEGTLNEVEKNMQDVIRWYGVEFVFSEMDKIGNPIHRCAHRKMFRELLTKMGIHWRPNFKKEEV